MRTSPCLCTTLSRSAENWCPGGSELSVFGCSELWSRYAWVTYLTGTECTSWGPFQPEWRYDPVILHFTSPELLLQPLGHPSLHPQLWLVGCLDSSWHRQQCFFPGGTAEQMVQDKVDVLSFIGRHIIKARYIWAGHHTFLTCIILGILESCLPQVFSLYVGYEPFCENHQASWLTIRYQNFQGLVPDLAGAGLQHC